MAGLEVVVADSKPVLDEILPRLFIANVDTASSPAAATINLFVNLSHATVVPQANDAQVLHLPIEDNPDADALSLFPTISAAMSQVYDRGGSVAVVCTAGVSRSPTFMMAFLISRGMTFDAALQACQLRRSTFSRPNPGFIKQLRMYEKSLLPTPS
jgi:atypical dual specificity phosphatase